MLGGRAFNVLQSQTRVYCTSWRAPAFVKVCIRPSPENCGLTRLKCLEQLTRAPARVSSSALLGRLRRLRLFLARHPLGSHCAWKELPRLLGPLARRWQKTDLRLAASARKASFYYDLRWSPVSCGRLIWWCPELWIRVSLVRSVARAQGMMN